MNIIKEYLTPNPYSRPKFKIGNIKGIIVHWVGNPNTSAKANHDYFNNRKYGRVICENCNKEVYAYELKFDGVKWICSNCKNTKLKYNWKNFVSTHYIIGMEGEIIQNIPLDEVTYHTGNITNKKTMKILGKNPNYNTIGIECCHPDMSGKPNRKTYNSLLELILYLLQLYKLDVDVNLFLHHDIYGKLCHKYFVENPAEWDGFKRLLKYRI